MIDRSNVILQGIVGSTAYGLDHEGSDVDRLGIYVAPINEVLGLRGPQVVTDSVNTHDPDTTLHEVGKYVSLALNANPTVLELLWLPSNLLEAATATGEWLRSYRDSFLSEKSVKGRYGGYVKAQAERLLRRTDEGKEGFSSDTARRTEKHGRHCFRLLMQGEELLRTGDLRIDMSGARDYLFRRGKQAAVDPQGFYDEVMLELAKFDAIESKLPEQPDREAVNALLVRIRKFENVRDR